MFKIIAPQDTLKIFEDAKSKRLSDILLIEPNFSSIIQNNMLWGIFSNNNAYSIDKSNERNLAHLDYTIVEKARAALDNAGVKNSHFFSPEVESFFQTNKLSVLLDSENCEVQVEIVAETKPLCPNYQGLLCLTFPDSTIAFESLIAGDTFDRKNEWLLEYMDIYEEWRHETMRCQYQYVWQIGGHGRWIQNDYNGTYLAQANIDIGDCGSVYLEVVEREPRGCVDMY